MNKIISFSGSFYINAKVYCDNKIYSFIPIKTPLKVNHNSCLFCKFNLSKKTNKLISLRKRSTCGMIFMAIMAAFCL